MENGPDMSKARYIDPVIQLYKQGIDRTLIQKSLQRTVQERIDAMIDHLRTIEELNRAGRAARQARGRKR